MATGLQAIKGKVQQEIADVVEPMIANALTLPDGAQGVKWSHVREELKKINGAHQADGNIGERVSEMTSGMAKDSLASQGFSHSNNVYPSGDHGDGQRLEYYTRPKI
ncbi:MAG: hypothetical protein AABX63_05390 [Nanoarchaeota archaeon]